MALSLPHRWVWDPWFVREGDSWHVFYLQAPKSIGDAEARHWNVSIGHAQSTDLKHWRIHPTALEPSRDDPHAWDSYTTWTGSIIEHEGRWHLFYTGGMLSEMGAIQRIGLAVSQDLIHWDKHPGNPLIVGDSQHYGQPDPLKGREQAWRDPWVFRHKDDGLFYALITARAGQGPRDGRGVIGLARSTDLLHWQVLPPVTEPGDFYDDMEVPQLLERGGSHYLFFSTTAHRHSAAWRSESDNPPVTGTYYMTADDPLGPYPPSSQRLLLGSPDEFFYAGKVLQPRDGEWVYLPALFHDHRGDFVGALGDPMDIHVDPRGELRIDPSPAQASR